MLALLPPIRSQTGPTDLAVQDDREPPTDLRGDLLEDLTAPRLNSSAVNGWLN
jgi:hypothetical protein